MRMKYAWCMIVAFGLVSNAQAGPLDKPPPEAYRDPIDQQIARTGKGVPGRPLPCAYEQPGTNGQIIESQPTALCVKMTSLQHFRGLWRAAMEGSTFCPEPATECPTAKGESIWLSLYPGRLRGELYHVDFIGRKTIYKGPYGHFGMFDSEVDIDRMIRMELISKPKAPSKKSVEEMKKNCAAKPGCDVTALMRDLKLIY